MVAKPDKNQVQWQQQAHQYWMQGNYAAAAHLYEEAIEAEPEVKSYYWNLGLLLLLQEQEEQAQTTWLLGMMEGDSAQIADWTEELVQVLHLEAQRQEMVSNHLAAWLIRQHIQEIDPTNIQNLLHLILLSLELDRFTGEELQEWEVVEGLDAAQLDSVNPQLLGRALQKVLEVAPLHPSTIEFAQSCLPYLQNSAEFFNLLLNAAMKIAYSLHEPAIAARLCQLCLQGNLNNPEEVLWHLADFYKDSGNSNRAIATARDYYALMETLASQAIATSLLMRVFMSVGSFWQEAQETLKQQESLLKSLTKNPPAQLDRVKTVRLLKTGFFFPYFEDSPQTTRTLQNQISKLCQNYIQSYAKKQNPSFSVFSGHDLRKTGKPIKIGYISHCLNTHSVGWLARWLFKHHDRDRFEIHGYFIGKREIHDPLQEWYVNCVEKANLLDRSDFLEAADRIYRDEIDILIDLDSLTFDTTCAVMALKPAPIQVTWLGWDVSGIPAVDYFIADPYVLPEGAEGYYSEKIWRLPQTYIAVDGFEVAVPTLRRDELEIPPDAVIYYSGQTAYKRHPEMARLQMKIVKAVPNSYFLVKGKADEKAVKNFFIQLAEAEGVERNRLKFLPATPSEAIHRANLGIADVVLDTYPYNGATTTLETLWMGIPLVTRVGEQFAARNSYAMMMNVGVTEGIAWSDREYVEWGIRLGLNPDLREDISFRLWQSRQTAPLWNGKQFAGEMEQAYEQMWQIYRNQQKLE